MDDGWTPRPDPGPAVLAEVPDLAPLVRAALRKRVPPAMRGGRLHLSWPAVAALAVVVALAVAGGAVLVLRGRAGPVAADQPLPTSSDFSPAPEGSAPAAATSTSTSIVIEVVGRVHHAGVFSLPLGSRVVDALKAAGGALPGTDTTSLGLAQKLTDGEQVRVGIGGAAPGPPAAGASDTEAGPLDLNTATEAQLDALPGVGPVLAQRILDWRTAHGSFASVDDLKQVQGLSGKKGDDLIALVTVG